MTYGLDLNFYSSEPQEVEALILVEEAFTEDVLPAEPQPRRRWRCAAAGVATLLFSALLLLGKMLTNFQVAPASETDTTVGRQVINLNDVLAAETATGKVAAALLATGTDPCTNATMSYSETAVHVYERSAWGKTLPGVSNFTGTVFYPFAGVDVLTVVPLFPKAQSIVLAALHKVGDCQALQWSDLTSRVAAVRGILSGNFAIGAYFGTEEMFQHLDDTGVGVTPALLASLHLAGQEAISIECGPNLGPMGTDLGLAAGDVVRILYKSRLQSAGAPSAPQELIYAQQDWLTPSPVLNKFLQALQRQAPLATIMKATGYIIRRSTDLELNRRAGLALHSEPLEQLILNASVTILQDDTGLRASCLDSWNRTFYGVYIGPAIIGGTPLNMSTDYDDGIHALACNRRVRSKPLPVAFGYPEFHVVSGCPAQYDGSYEGLSADPGPLRAPIRSLGFALLATRST